MALNPRDIDKRLVRRQIERGRVDEGEYNQYLEALPDVSDKVAPRNAGSSDDDAADAQG